MMYVICRRQIPLLNHFLERCVTLAFRFGYAFQVSTRLRTQICFQHTETSCLIQSYTVIQIINAHRHKKSLQTLKEVIQFSTHVRILSVERMQRIFQNSNKSTMFITGFGLACVTVAKSLHLLVLITVLRHYKIRKDIIEIP
jgi:hypothetical protein